MDMLEYEKEHLAALRPYLAECTVLLKSKGDFPFSAPCKLALYGSGARHTGKGGTGSGDVNSRFFVTVEQGLRDAGFEITTKQWLDAYDQILPAAHKYFIKGIKKKAREKHTMALIEGMGAVMPEPEYDIPLDADGDVAVYVLARVSGEGSDRNFVPGDILLSETEIRNILALNEKFEHFMLVLNVGGPVDLSPVLAIPNILVLSQLGVETGSILADLLLGKAYPSGKLTTTWAAEKDYPSIGEFGNPDDTRYTEGVYVGYRYFDTAGVQPSFPFGYGLSYTTFEVRDPEAKAEGETIKLSATVKNTGMRAGKETVQCYVSSPQGKLDQPWQSLAAFAKTQELQPGEETQVELSFLFSDLASYDEERAAWIMEQGDYIVRIGTSSRDTEVCTALRLSEEVIVRQVRNAFDAHGIYDWKCPAPRKAETPDYIPVIEMDAAALVKPTPVYDREYPIDPIIEAMSDEELAYMSVGAFNPNNSFGSVIGNASFSVAGAAGETAGRFKDIPALIMADGPAGLRLSRDYIRDEKGAHTLGSTMPDDFAALLPAPLRFLTSLTEKKPKKSDEVQHQYTTAIPIGTAIAQSWNPDFAEICGDIIGEEMERFGIHLWLAPALNIHRNIRCGRNFEYYSEDPLLSGVFSAAITHGVQSHPGCGVTIKHFAANNQETNRYFSNSIVSERALREIYLRGFELCIRLSQPHALMTSYNLINGTHTAERRDLIEDTLRSEFGFEGIVMTDWLVSMGGPSIKSVHPAAQSARVASAGGDLFMPGSKNDYQNVLDALKAGGLDRRQAKINATRVYRTAVDLSSNDRRV